MDKRNNNKKKNDIQKRVLLTRILFGDRKSKITRNFLLSGFLWASCALAPSLNFAVENPIPSPLTENTLITLDESSVQDNDVYGANFDLVIGSNSSGFTLTNNAAIESLGSLDFTNIEEFINGTEGSLTDFTGDISGSTLTNEGLISEMSDTVIDVSTLKNETAGHITNIKSIEADTLTNNGIIDYITDGSNSNEPAIAVSGTLTNTGFIKEITGNIYAASLVNSGTLTNMENNYLFTTAVNNQTGGEIYELKSIFADSITNAGTINNIGNVDISGGNLNNSGTFTNVKSVSITDGNFINTGLIRGVNHFNVNGGSITNNGGTLGVQLKTGNSAPVEGLYSASNNAGTFSVINSGSVRIDASEIDGQSWGTQKYVFLTSEGGLQVDQALTIDANSIAPVLFNYKLGHDDQNYWISLERKFQYGQAAPNENSENFGHYLDKAGSEVVSGSDLEDVLTALDSLNTTPGTVSPAARQAMTQMDGSIYGSIQTVSVQNHALINNQLGNLLRPAGNCGCASLCEESTGLNFWAKFVGSKGSTDSDGNAAGFDLSQSGVMIGGDGDIGACTRIGFYFSYLDSAMEMDGLNQQADILNYMFGIYSIRETGNGYWLANANYGYDQYDTDRRIQFGSGAYQINRNITGNTNGHQAGIRLERGFDFKTDRTLFQPFVNVQYIHADTDLIRESGGDSLNLRINAEDYNSLRSEIGARYVLFRSALSNEGYYRGANIMFQGSWIHEYETTSGTIHAETGNSDLQNYTGTAHYMVRGADPGSDWANLGVGANWSINRLTLFGGYDFLINDLQTISTGNAGLAFCW